MDETESDVELDYPETKEDYEKLIHQLQYFRYKIEGLRYQIAPHLRGHTFIGTEECVKRFEEYYKQLQHNFKMLDHTLNQLSLLLGKEHGRSDLELHEEF
jgi:hypothetical protein